MYSFVEEKMKAFHSIFFSKSFRFFQKKIKLQKNTLERLLKILQNILFFEKNKNIFFYSIF
jgi:hypothetical protein